MPIPLVIRVLAAAKEAKDWFSFANEAFSALGLVKRTAAATAGAAVLAGAGAGLGKAVEVATTTPQERAIGKAIAVHAPDITTEIREQVIKVTATNTYSKMFLEEEKNRPILDAILAICLDGAALPAVQCDDANYVKKRLEYQERVRAERARIAERNRKFRENFNTDGLIPR